MNKKTKYGISGVVIGSIVGALIDAFRQYNKSQSDPTYKYDWKSTLGNAALGAAVGGSAGFAAGAFADLLNSQEKPVNTDVFLLSASQLLQLEKNSDEYLNLDAKVNELINYCRNEFKGQLSAAPKRIGSTEKGTALNYKYDVDIALAFKPGSFTSTAHMFETVNSTLEKLIGTNSVTRIREQGRSVGIFIQIRGKEYKIDVVPGKVTAKKGNKTSAYLYVNDPRNPSYTKTDFHILSKTTLTTTQKRLVVLLKNWKHKNNLPLKGYLIENLVIDAYKYNSVPRNITPKLIMILTHIRDKMDVAVIRSAENSNNVLTNIPESDKSIIINACSRVIKDYQYQPNSILDHFEYV